MVISKGEIELLSILRRIFRGHKITKQFHVGERLRLDFFIPHLNLGLEWDGIQHSQKIEFFDKQKSLANRQYDDERKEYLCKKLGIALIRFDYTQKLSHEIVQMAINHISLLEETEELKKLKDPTDDCEKKQKIIKKKNKEVQKKKRKKTSAEFKQTQKYKDMKEMSKKIRKQAYKEQKERLKKGN